MPASNEPGEPPGIRQDASASDSAQLYQAGRDQVFGQTVLLEGAIRPAAQVDPPPGLVNVPLVPAFVGRARELDLVDRALETPGDVVIAAVHGLGGIGKSTLAARYARRQAGSVSPIWWVTADSAPSVQAGLAGLAAALQPQLASLELEPLAEWALTWLGCHHDWLLILDNVNDLADIELLLNRTSTGRVLITSRRADLWHELPATLIRLDVLTEHEAVALLARGAPDTDPADMPDAERLVQKLGFLPLAIEQAAAYLRHTRTTPGGYLRLLSDSPATAFSSSASSTPTDRTIARIWRITLDALAATPLAGQLLRMLAWYAPEAIPRPLLAGVASGTELDGALGELAAYNMITLTPGTVTVHRLVQALARTPDPGDPHRLPADIDNARERATDLLNRYRPPVTDDPALWPRWRALLPHIDALLGHVPPSADTITTARLTNWTASFLQDQGALSRALRYCERGLAADRRLAGEDDLNTLRSRNNLADAYRAVGDLERAVPLFEATLADCERVLGADHPDTLSSRNNLAGAYRAAGDLRRAVPLFEATLADFERVHGADHPNTLVSRNNLAFVYWAAGDLRRAVPLLEATLADCERVLGADHPDTLISRNNLAGAYRAAGDLRRAVPLFEATLADRERVLGADHPDTLTSRNNLASAYRAVGDLERAVPLFEATLADCERVHGADHPDTLISRNNLAYIYEQAGRLADARRLKSKPSSTA